MSRRDSYAYVGKSFVAVDAERKIRGEAVFAGDLDVGRALVGKLIRSPHAHAKILAIDLSRARKVKGVKAVISADDLPDVRMGTGILDKPLLARKVVRHVGEPVVAIAGVSERACEAAAKLVKIAYRPMPAIFDAEEAIAEHQKIVVHPELSSYVKTAKWPPDLGRPNISSCWGLKRGDVEKGFAQSDVVIENTFRTAAVQHVPLEPHSAVARVEADGSVTVWGTPRTPAQVNAVVAMMLEMPLSKVHLVTTHDVGGSFGGKSDGVVEALAAWLARYSRMPVKLLLDRAGEFVTVTKHGFVVKIKDGISRDGIIKSRKIEIILDGGAYSGSPVPRNCTFGAETYKVGNLEVDSYRAYTNLPYAGSLRGFGITDVTTAIEQQMDIIAAELGMDPVEFRLKNLCVQGDVNNLGETMRSLGSRECLTAVAEAIKSFKAEGKTERGLWRRGFGISIGQKYSQAPTQSHCEVKAHPDGSIEVFVGGIDTGQGFATTMSQIAAEEMATPMNKIHVRMRSLGRPVYDVGGISSRQTFNTGNAVRLALVDLKKQIFDLVHQLGEAPEELRYADGAIYPAAGSEPLLKLSDLFCDHRSYWGGYSGPRELLQTIPGGGELVGKSVWVVKSTPMDPRDSRLLVEETSEQEVRVNAFYTPAAAAAEVMVNVGTGEVRVTRLFCAVDGGKIMNPTLAEGQVEGAACMAVGAALMEEMYRDGDLLGTSFREYAIPTAADMPTIENFKIFFVESPQPDGPFGAKGMSEVAIVPVPAAIANAVADAIGKRVAAIPITPDRVLRALRGEGAEAKTVFCFPRALGEIAPKESGQARGLYQIT